MAFLTKSLPRRTVLRGLGATMALPFLEAMLPPFSLRAQAVRETRASVPDVLCAERHGHGVLVAQGRRQRLRTLAHSGAAGAVPQPDAGAVGHQGELELHPRGRLRIVSHGRHARRTKRGGDHRRCVDGPDPRQALRQGDAGGVARTFDGPAGQRGRLHRQPELRLHPHAFVAQPHAAAAHGVEPASGVREAVWRQRQHGAGRARSQIAAAQEHPGLGDREAGGPQKGAGAAGSGQGGRIYGGDSRRRTPHPESRGAARCRTAGDGAAAGRAAGLRRSPGA